MKGPKHRPIRETVEDEFVGAEFGDKRLGARLVELARRMARCPENSFPHAASNAGELEATYRFLNNDRVGPETILAPHVRETVRRSQMCAQVVIAHDTTEFNFGRSSRDDLGRVGRGKSFGFYGHFALAVDATEERMPLGVVSLAVHQRHGGKGRSARKTRQDDPTNEFHRWGHAIEDAEGVLESVDPVHVMDREADSYALMAELVDAKTRFVIRMAHSSRRTVTEDVPVGEVLARVDTLAERSVPISARGRNPMPSNRKHHPERKSRTAHLQVCATTVSIKRPESSNATAQKTVTLNVVRVFEPDPPQGEAAIEWRLWTTEPVETGEQALRVVDFYRCRWRIEEFFKALKTGCAIEQRQLETHDGLVNALALMTPIAWRLLRLRTLASEQSEAPAERALSARQIRCLNAALRDRGRSGLPDKPTAREAMLGIAALGGHIRNNGDPGWIVLGRGFDDLLMIELGFILATGAESCDQS
jgi:hypothetical protein